MAATVRASLAAGVLLAAAAAPLFAAGEGDLAACVPDNSAPTVSLNLAAYATFQRTNRPVGNIIFTYQDRSFSTPSGPNTGATNIAINARSPGGVLSGLWSRLAGSSCTVKIDIAKDRMGRLESWQPPDPKNWLIASPEEGKMRLEEHREEVLINTLTCSNQVKDPRARSVVSESSSAQLAENCSITALRPALARAPWPPTGLAARLGFAAALTTPPPAVPADAATCQVGATTSAEAGECYRQGLERVGKSESFEALAYFERALAAGKLPEYYVALGITHSIQTNWTEAVQVLNDGRDEMECRGDAGSHALISYHLARILIQSPPDVFVFDDRARQALRYARESLELRRKIPDNPEIGNSLSVVAEALRTLASDGWTMDGERAVDCRPGEDASSEAARPQACKSDDYTLTVIRAAKKLAAEAFAWNRKRNANGADAARDADLLASLYSDESRIQRYAALGMRELQQTKLHEKEKYDKLSKSQRRSVAIALPDAIARAASDAAEAAAAAEKAEREAVSLDAQARSAAAESLKYFDIAREIDRENGNGELPQFQAWNDSNRARALWLGGQPEESAKTASDAARRYAEITGPIHTKVALNKRIQGEALFAAGERKKAETAAREALQIDWQVLGSDHPDSHRDLNLLGRILGNKELLAAAAGMSTQYFGSSHFESQKFQYDVKNNRSPRSWWKYAAVAAAGVAVGVLINRDGGGNNRAVIGVGGGGVRPPGQP